MKRNLVIVSLLLLVYSCQQTTKVQNYPNEMSEMALSMRTMVDKLKQAKIDIELGVTPNLSIEDFKNAHFTDSSFQKEGFNPMAEALLIAANNFDESPSVLNYEIVVNTCRSCHEYMCPGPLEMINTLDLN
ncbi:MAG: hypothetical protein CND86_04890 [Bacteroidetes bacterium MED-G21]|nr:MAG: hypothetical protein CND86_04890 [Bacteroidetes bacterium MED-G21]|tara:strand:- start:276 stop:668 length:393 start_codon:yes stop_codon:yes gene_type:complete